MAAASILPRSPRGAEGSLTFEPPGSPTVTASDMFAKEFHQDVRRLGLDFCRLELALKRSCPPVWNAWDAFIKFALERDAINEGVLSMLVCDWLAEDMGGNVNDSEMQRTGCTVIAACCQSHAENREMMASRGLMAAAIQAMNKHPQCPTVHIAALQAVLALCRNENNLSRAWDCRVLSTVSNALESHRRVLEVQRLGKQVLSLFTTSNISSKNQREEDRQRKRRRNDNKMEYDEGGVMNKSNLDFYSKRAESSQEAEGEEEEEEKDCESCIICMQESRTHAFLPCGHLCVCRSCADTVQDQKKNSSSSNTAARACCPVCRGPFHGAARIYTA